MSDITPFSGGTNEENDSPKVKIKAHQLRDFSTYKNRQVDDKQYGIEPGMVLMPEPLSNAINDVLVDGNKDCKIIFPTPDGELFNHSMAKDFSNNKELTFICGHYKGIDQRIRDKYVTDEVSIGDYVLTSGELPTMIMIDSIVRLKEGVLNNYNSACKDSFYDLLLDGPHYTRPRKFKNMCVPEEILSGNHKEIEKWFLRKREEKTKLKREDLYIKYKSSKKDREKNV